MTKAGRGTIEDPGPLVQKRANENRAPLGVSPRTIRPTPHNAAALVKLRCRQPHQPFLLRLYELQINLRRPSECGEEIPAVGTSSTGGLSGDGL
jgi:hypothetical protein